MDWFKRKDKKIKEKNKKAIPDGLWEKCPSCKEIIFKPELDKKKFYEDTQRFGMEINKFDFFFNDE